MSASIRPGAAMAAAILSVAMAPAANAAPPDDACSLLSQSQLSAALNATVGAGSYVTPTYKKTCIWNSAGDGTKGAKNVTLMLEGVDAFRAGKQTRQMKASSVTPASGIGDEAYYLAVGGNVGLIVKKGNVAFKIAVYGSLPVDKKQALEKALAEHVVSKL